MVSPKEYSMTMDVDQISIIDVQEIPANIQEENESSAKHTVELSIVKVEELSPNNEEEGKSEDSQDIAKSNYASYWNMAHIVTILMASTIALSPQLLIPRYNTIYYPDSRHQIFIDAVSLMVIMTLRYLMDIVVFTKEKSIIKMQVAFKMLSCLLLPWVILVYLTHYIWTSILGFEHPMPFFGVILLLVVYPSLMCSLRFGVVFPPDLRNNAHFRSKIKTFVKYELWWFVMNIQKELLSLTFNAIPGNLQFLFALFIPAIKELNKIVLSKLLTKMAGKDDVKSQALMDIRLSIHYEFFVAIKMDGAENLTVACILLVDIILQLRITRKIIQLNRKITNEKNEEGALNNQKESAIMNLLLEEIIEGIVPIAYAIGFAMAYYGPNGNLTGNVLSDLWAYNKVEDVGKLMYIQLLLFGVDCISVVLNMAILKLYGNVDPLQEFSKVMKTYWMLFALQLANTISIYFGFNDINYAMDMTGEFSWITREGRLKFISNSSDLSDYEKASILSNINTQEF